MEELPLQKIKLIGRDEELNQLKAHFENAISGMGSTVLISGEAGVGKTRLVEEFKNYSASKNVRILSGSTVSDTVHPFLIFSKALENEIEKPLFQEQESKSFNAIFAVNKSGILVAQVTSETDNLDADIFAGMLSAVQDFVSDSFDSTGKQKTGLGRLEYGDMKIMIEHGSHLFLTAVFQGTEHPDMKTLLRTSINIIEEDHGKLLESWNGRMDEVAPIQKVISSLANAKFLVRRDLEGIKLENERIRIADNVLETLTLLSADKPLILLLEDLHWADESSLFVLNYLSRNIKEKNILIAGTLRPEMGIGLQTTIEKMTREGCLFFMPLIQLGSDSISSLIEAMHPGNNFPEPFVEHMASACEGNPFFVIELLKQMKEEGNISTVQGKDVLISQDYSIPGSVDEVVQRRLDILDPETMALAEYISCIGRFFDCKAAMSASTVQSPAGALERLQNSGIIILNDGSGEFCHAIFHDVIYSGIGDRWKLTYHQGLGEFFEAEYSQSLDDVIYDLARHFSRSKVHRKGYEYCFMAGEKAENVFALEQALSFYEGSFKSLGELRSLENSQARKLVLMERMGDINIISGNYEESLKLFGSALGFADTNENKARVLRKTASVNVEKGEFDIALEILANAKDMVEEGSVEHGRILMDEGNPYLRKGEYSKAMPFLLEGIKVSNSAGINQKDIGNALRSVGNIHWYMGDYDSALQSYEESLKIMEEIGHKHGIASTLNNIGNVHHAMGNMPKALEYFGNCLEIMEKIGSKQGIAASLNNLGLVYYELGEPARSLEFFERSLEIKEKIGDKQGTALSLSNIGNVYHFTGKLAKSMKYYEHGLEIMKEIGDKWGIALSLNNVGNVHHSMGNLDMSLEYYQKGYEIRESIGDKHGIARSLISLGNVSYARGELNKALEYHENSIKIYLEIGDKLESIHPHLGLAETYLALGKFQESLENALEAVKLSIETSAKQEEGKSHRVLGVVHLKMGDLDMSETEFEKSKLILSEIGYERELAKLYYGQALLYREKDEPDKFQEHFDKSLSMFEEMGMKLWTERAKKALEEI